MSYFDKTSAFTAKNSHYEQVMLLWAIDHEDQESFDAMLDDINAGLTFLKPSELRHQVLARVLTAGTFSMFEKVWAIHQGFLTVDSQRIYEMMSAFEVLSLQPEVVATLKMKHIFDVSPQVTSQFTLQKDHVEKFITHTRSDFIDLLSSYGVLDVMKCPDIGEALFRKMQTQWLAYRHTIHQNDEQRLEIRAKATALIRVGLSHSYEIPDENGHGRTQALHPTVPLFDLMIAADSRGEAAVMEWIEALVENGADINRAYEGDSLLGSLCVKRSREAALRAQHLFRLGADPNVENLVPKGSKSVSAWQKLLDFQGDFAMKEVFLDAGCNINQLDYVGKTLLERAIASEPLANIKKILDRGASAKPLFRQRSDNGRMLARVSVAMEQNAYLNANSHSELRQLLQACFEKECLEDLTLGVLSTLPEPEGIETRDAHDRSQTNPTGTEEAFIQDKLTLKPTPRRL